MAGSTSWIVAIAALGSLALQASAGVADGVKYRECWWLDRSSGKPVPKETNLNNRGVAGGRCFATMEFERRSYSFTRCEDSYTKNAFSWPAVKGKRVRVIRLGICGDADVNSGSSAFQFRGMKGTTEWGFQAGQTSQMMGAPLGMQGDFRLQDVSRPVGGSCRAGQGKSLHIGGLPVGGNAVGLLSMSTDQILKQGQLGTTHRAGTATFPFAWKENEAVEIDSLGMRDPDGRYCVANGVQRANPSKLLNINDRNRYAGSWRILMHVMYECTIAQAKKDPSCYDTTPRCAVCNPNAPRPTYTRSPCVVDKAGFMDTAGQCGACGPACVEGEFEAQQCKDFKDSTGFVTRGQSRRCEKWSTCDKDHQYVFKKGTKTEDAVCRFLTRCSGPEIEAVKPSATSDRKCRIATECKEGEWEKSAPKLGAQDRVCQATKECKEDEFEAAPPTDKADRVCKQLTDCTGSNQIWESTAPTATSDRVCSYLTRCNITKGEITLPMAAKVDGAHVFDTECQQCDFATEYISGRAQKSCEKLTVCGKFPVQGQPEWPRAETKETRPAQRDADRACANTCYTCPAGTHAENDCVNPDTAAADCKMCKACTKDEVMVAPCTVKADRQCAPALTPNGAAAAATAGKSTIKAANKNLHMNKPVFVGLSGEAGAPVAQQMQDMEATEVELARAAHDVARMLA